MSTRRAPDANGSVTRGRSDDAWRAIEPGDKAIGAFARPARSTPFSDDEIALVKSFAAQAVIAIENVRQFRELQTRLEREAATREILSVISQSQDDEQPVFDVILKSASRLCNAPLAFLSMANEERTHVNIRAMLGARAEFTSLVENFHEPIDRGEIGCDTAHC